VTELAAKPLEGGQETFTVRIDVSPSKIVHSIYAGSGWHSLDDWTPSDRQFAGGQFGFLISGNDEIGISNFHFSGPNQ
jgi:hypothetical protein